MYVEEVIIVNYYVSTDSVAGRSNNVRLILRRNRRSEEIFDWGSTRGRVLIGPCDQVA